jgi:hypothetical protein
MIYSIDNDHVPHKCCYDSAIIKDTNDGKSEVVCECENGYADLICKLLNDDFYKDEE